MSPSVRLPPQSWVYQLPKGSFTKPERDLIQASAKHLATILPLCLVTMGPISHTPTTSRVQIGVTVPISPGWAPAARWLSRPEYLGSPSLLGLNLKWHAPVLGAEKLQAPTLALWHKPNFCPLLSIHIRAAQGFCLGPTGKFILAPRPNKRAVPLRESINVLKLN